MCRSKFPELESLVHHPIDYAKVVQAIGNEMDVTLIDLEPILPQVSHACQPVMVEIQYVCHRTELHALLPGEMPSNVLLMARSQSFHAVSVEPLHVPCWASQESSMSSFSITRLLVGLTVWLLHLPFSMPASNEILSPPHGDEIDPSYVSTLWPDCQSSLIAGDGDGCDSYGFHHLRPTAVTGEPAQGAGRMRGRLCA